LSEIVARPDLARPVEGARDAIAGLTQRYRTVAIVTGRRSEEVAAFLDLPHVMYVGLYGFEEETPELLTAVVPLVETAAAPEYRTRGSRTRGARSRSTTGRRPTPTPREPR
jgi:trehalose-6-phosphatase